MRMSGSHVLHELKAVDGFENQKEENYGGSCVGKHSCVSANYMCNVIMIKSLHFMLLIARPYHEMTQNELFPLG